MATLAGVGDLEVWLGVTLTGTTDEPRADAVLAAASALIRAEAGKTWDTDPVPDEIAQLAVRVAARVYKNPDGFKSERVGEYSYDRGESSGLSLTVSERAVVARYRLAPGGLWSLRTSRGELGLGTEYVPVVGAPPFPWYADA